MLRSPYRAFISTLLLAVPAVVAAAGGRSAPPFPPERPTEQQVEFFEKRVRPILAARCQGCHGPARQSGGLRLDSRAAILKGGGRGPAVLPGRPEASILLKAVSAEAPAPKMPPQGALARREIADLAAWVKDGALWENTGVPHPSSLIPHPSEHWAFRPVRVPALPAVKNPSWCRTPIDRFILAGLDAKGLHPAPAADRRTLIRRATYDLTGLPPTPAETDAFLADASPGAFNRVVERLLASPAYGERWGRHWLDVARYADSNGLDENVAYGNAWRYRDWVIRAFNEDRPFDRFVLEQLAGDLMPAADRKTRYSRLIATGFLALGPKVLAEVDKDKMVMDIVDEQIDTVGKAFMGLTLGCARCHDHKFDPISTEDYYALAGIFKSTRTMESLKTVARWWENPIPEDADLAAQQAHQKRVATVESEIRQLVDRAKSDLAAAGPPGSALKKDLEAALEPEPRARLKQLRDRLAQIQKEAPEMPSAMGVTEAEAVDVAVHVRGDHLNLGPVVKRRFPVILAGTAQAPLPAKQSGRMELARWLADPRHPLTSRVMVNRVWDWHFGRGLVASTDNFGKLGEVPSNPALLDWLAAGFAGVRGQASGAGGRGSDHSPLTTDPWSIKGLHRLIMSSSTYRMSSRFDARAAQIDPENRLHWRANVQRLDAEETRDSVLAVSGLLDRTMGGSLLQVKNHEFFFDHTSRDTTKYDSRRRAIYLPVVRNHVYDVFQLFDFVDPAVLQSHRATTTVPPQALFWMNSDLVADAARALAALLLQEPGLDEPGRIRAAYLRLYGRLPGAGEIRRGESLLAALEAVEADPARRRQSAWSRYCHTLLAANEFSFLR